MIYQPSNYDRFDSFDIEQFHPQFYSMTTHSFAQDPTDLLLSQHRTTPHNRNHAYFQVDYLQKHILKLNPEEAHHYQKSVEQQNLKEYIDENNKDNNRYLHFKHNVKSLFFKIRSKKPPILQEMVAEKEPIQMIKSYSQPVSNLKKSKIMQSFKQYPLSSSVVTNGSISSPKSRYSDSIQVLLDSSLILTKQKNKYRLQGGTMREKQKIAQKIMREEKEEILQIIKNKDYNTHRPSSLEEISNKEKYSMDFIDYMRLKTKTSLNRQIFQKKIRKPNSRLQNFQEFILQEGKFKGEAKEKLSNFYIKVREQFRRIQNNSNLSKSKSRLQIANRQEKLQLI